MSVHNIFSMRAECSADIDQFLSIAKNIRVPINVIQRKILDEGFPDESIEFTLQDHRIARLKSLLQSIPDSHVMLGTLKQAPMEDNSLSRHYSDIPNIKEIELQSRQYKVAVFHYLAESLGYDLVKPAELYKTITVNPDFDGDTLSLVNANGDQYEHVDSITFNILKELVLSEETTLMVISTSLTGDFNIEWRLRVGNSIYSDPTSWNDIDTAFNQGLGFSKLLNTKTRSRKP